jgi:periplasmic protein TonB
MNDRETPASSDEQPTPVRNIVSSGWLAGDSVFDRRDTRKVGRGLLASLGLHGAIFGAIALFLLLAPRETINQVQEQIVHLVYLPEKGPGGGGGGSQAAAPPKPIEVPMHRAPTPPPLTPPKPVPVPPPPDPTLTAPIITNSSVAQATGASTVSLAAFGGGGRGTGLGSGRGNGVGPGEGGGFGGGAYQPGNGITTPVLLRQVEPKYTSDAMRSKVQGTVELQAIVLPDGHVGDVRVVKSLDRTTGLDDEAMKAARLWLFEPGKNRDGKPVPVVITIAMDFRLH